MRSNTPRSTASRKRKRVKREPNCLWVVEMRDDEAFSTTDHRFEPSVFVGLTRDDARERLKECQQNDGFTLRLRRYVPEPPKRKARR